MNTRKTLGLLAGFTLAANAAVADVFIIGGYTFNDDNSVTTAAVVEGKANLRTHAAPLFAGRGDLKTTAASALTFQRDKSIGRLLGKTNRRTAGYPALSVSLPDKHASPPKPNVERSTIELTWGGKGLRNKPGADFVVYEVGSFEGFMVSVKKAGSDSFTAPRYQFVNEFDAEHNVNAIAFDLSLFGLADGEAITAIRIRNIFNSEAVGGADKVEEASGQGRVLFPGEAGYDTAHTLSAPLVEVGLKTGGGASREFRTDELDADIVFVVGLHDLEKVE